MPRWILQPTTGMHRVYLFMYIWMYNNDVNCVRGALVWMRIYILEETQLPQLPQLILSKALNVNYTQASSYMGLLYVLYCDPSHETPHMLKVWVVSDNYMSTWKHGKLDEIVKKVKVIWKLFIWNPLSCAAEWEGFHMKSSWAKYLGIFFLENYRNKSTSKEELSSDRDE